VGGSRCAQYEKPTAPVYRSNLTGETAAAEGPTPYRRKAVTKTRQLDVVVWGATGFTGRLVALYLCKAYGVGDEVRWAIAGRNREKLEAIRAELAAITPKASELELLIGDSHDLDSLKTIAQTTKVVLTTVGPYAAYGATLVQACVESGTHYVDLTGETPFIRQMIDAHHEEAQKKGVRIVHCCGFDSVPSDMGVFFLQQQAQKTWGKPASSISMYVEASRGGVSGGTIASMMQILEAAKDRSVRRVLGNPYALNPDDGVRGPDGSDQSTVKWSDAINKWTAPFVMAGINTRVVRRSNAVTDYAYGEDFSYSEVVAMKKGLKGWTSAQGLTLGLGAFVALAVMGWTRSLMQATVLPAPGEGPSPEAQEKGFFRIRLVGRRDGERLDVLVKGKRDPGYGATARMLTEAALCLALAVETLPNRSGVLTPASALGETYISRLAKADVTFTVET
jgi:short subunit dehydrogenase-like uncharacterized protein